MNRFIQVAKDLQIKQLEETVKTFTNPEESEDDTYMESRHGNISNQDKQANNEDVAEYVKEGRSISSIADDIINLDIPAYNPGSV